MNLPGALLAERYRLEHLLGEGGMGSVWRAKDERMRRPVAVKLLKGRSAGGFARTEAADVSSLRLLREAQVAAASKHPGLVQVHDVQIDGDAPFLVMELLEGKSLRHCLEERGPLPLGITCALLSKVASAVLALHEQGIIHRDLKPENIFLLGEGEISADTEVKVLDYGIAKFQPGRAETGAEVLTGADVMIGSPPYMSPEQVFREADIDHRTDLWSFGIVLYECLSGVLPTRGAHTGEVLKIITTLGIEPIERRAPGLPQPIISLLGRLLSRSVEARPASITEVIGVLDRYAERPGPSVRLDSVGGLSIPKGQPEPADPPALTPSLPPGAAPARPKRWKSGMVIAALGLLVVLIVRLKSQSPADTGPPEALSVSSSPPPSSPSSEPGPVPSSKALKESPAPTASDTPVAPTTSSPAGGPSTRDTPVAPTTSSLAPRPSTPVTAGGTGKSPESANSTAGIPSATSWPPSNAGAAKEPDTGKPAASPDLLQQRGLTERRQNFPDLTTLGPNTPPGSAP